MRELELVYCNDIGQFYKFVNRKLSVRKSIPPIKSADGSLLSNSLDQANAFNQYFASAFTTDDGNKPHCKPRATQDCVLSDIEFTPAKVHEILKDLKPNFHVD